jgi:hypothetical protein
LIAVEFVRIFKAPVVVDVDTGVVGSALCTKSVTETANTVFTLNPKIRVGHVNANTRRPEGAVVTGRSAVTVAAAIGMNAESNESGDACPAAD